MYNVPEGNHVRWSVGNTLPIQPLTLWVLFLNLSHNLRAEMASGSSGSDGRTGNPDAWWYQSGWWYNSKYGHYESWDDNKQGSWSWDWSHQQASAPAVAGGPPPVSQHVEEGTTATRTKKRTHELLGSRLVAQDLDNSDGESDKWIMPESEPDLDDDGTGSDYEEQTEAHKEAKALFWKSECEVRIRSAGLSAFEVHQMEKSHPLWINDFRKVINQFGQAHGPNRACRTLLMQIAKNKSMIPGQEVDIDSPEFSLCKHLLIQAWAYFHQPENKRQVTLDTVRCCCLPRTALMPCGCYHKKQPLWKVPWYLSTLCQTCSTCYRCGGLLGLEIIRDHYPGE